MILPSTAHQAAKEKQIRLMQVLLTEARPHCSDRISITPDCETNSIRKLDKKVIKRINGFLADRLIKAMLHNLTYRTNQIFVP
jgi:hypothetical protein